MFHSGNCCALAASRATSNANAPSVAKPEKSQSGRISSCGEWYALSLNSCMALRAKSAGLPCIFMPQPTEKAGTPARASEKWSDRKKTPRCALWSGSISNLFLAAIACTFFQRVVLSAPVVTTDWGIPSGGIISKLRFSAVFASGITGWLA